MVTAPTMIAKHSPVLEPCERMLDASSPPAMEPPSAVTQHTLASKGRRHEVSHSAIAAVCEHTSMRGAQRREP
jgi:hypothetical protein